MHQERWENAYLTLKNIKASRALKWAQYLLTLLVHHHYAMLEKSGKKIALPPIKSWIPVADPGFPRGGGTNPKGGGANLLFGQYFPKTA